MNKETCNCTLLSEEKVNARNGENKFTLQPLSYAENALAPYISEKTIQYHYGKHLLAYIDNTNKLKAGTEFDDMKIQEAYSTMQPRYLTITSISRLSTHTMPPKPLLMAGQRN